MAAMRSCPTIFSEHIKMTGDRICSSEDQLPSLSKENRDQIRNTMLRHEELFKEQVQALHKLYDVQKSVMQEVMKLIQRSAQPLASSSNDKVFVCNQLNYTVLGGKPADELYVCARNQAEESCVFTMDLPVAKEFTGSSSEKSFCSDGKDEKASPSASNKQKKTFDLERPPEEYMDESDYQVESNNFDILGNSSHLFEDSQTRCKQAVVLIGDQSLKQQGRACFSISSDPSQESQALEKKTETSFIKSATAIQKLQESPDNLIPEGSQLSATNSFVDAHVELPSWLLQQAASFPAKRSNSSQKADFFESPEPCLDKNGSEQVKDNIPTIADFAESIQLHQAPKSDGKVTVPHMELEKQLQEDQEHLPSYGSSLPTNNTKFPGPASNCCTQGVPCSVTSLPAKSVYYCSNTLTFQTDDDPRYEDPNVSGHRSNNPVHQHEKVSENTDLSTSACNNSRGSSDCEQIQIDRKVAATETELKDASQLSKNDANCTSTPAADHKQQHATEVMHTINCAATEKVLEEPVMEGESNEVTKSEPALEEACESIAAKILLSFAPSKSPIDSKWQLCQTQIEVEPSQSSKRSMGQIKRQTRHTRRTLSYSSRIGMGEAVTWTACVCGRRRTSRR